MGFRPSWEKSQFSYFCAIDLNQIKVTFTKEVDKTTAETVTSYVVNGVALSSSVDAVELQADKKTVLINLGGTPKGQYAKEAFKVKANLIFGNGTTGSCQDSWQFYLK